MLDQKLGGFPAIQLTYSFCFDLYCKEHVAFDYKCDHSRPVVHHSERTSQDKTFHWRSNGILTYQGLGTYNRESFFPLPEIYIF